MSKPVGFTFNKKYKKDGVDREFSIDLTRWLIPGGAAQHQRSFDAYVKDDDWNNVDEARIPLLQDLMKHLNNVFRKGRSKASVVSAHHIIREFWSYCEIEDKALIKENLGEAFNSYDRFRYAKAWGKSGTSSKKSTAYRNLHELSSFIDATLGVHESKKHRLFSSCIKAYKKPRKTVLSPTAEKQNLDEVRVFASFISDVCKEFTIEKVKEDSLINFNYTVNGETKESHYPNRLTKNGFWQAHNSEAFSTRTRIRVEAELLMFALYTSMNRGQIIELPLGDFDWEKKGNNWHVTVYKPRAGEAKSFYIPNEYRERLKSYLEYVKEFYPNSKLLFPIGEVAFSLRNIKNFCNDHEIPWFPPSELRTVKANFIYRLDPGLEPELIQHKAETFRQHYHQPSLLKTSQEISAFWQGQSTNNLGGGCNLEPRETKDRPEKVIKPNCHEASGCLWCENYRDVESLDYVWSLLSFREVMFIERKWTLMDTYTKPDYVIERIAQRLNALKEMSERFSDWINEAERRIASRRFHPTWDSLLKAIA